MSQDALTVSILPDLATLEEETERLWEGLSLPYARMPIKATINGARTGLGDSAETPSAATPHENAVATPNPPSGLVLMVGSSKFGETPPILDEHLFAVVNTGNPTQDQRIKARLKRELLVVDDVTASALQREEEGGFRSAVARVRAVRQRVLRAKKMLVEHEAVLELQAHVAAEQAAFARRCDKLERDAKRNLREERRRRALEVEAGARDAFAAEMSTLDPGDFIETYREACPTSDTTQFVLGTVAIGVGIPALLAYLYWMMGQPIFPMPAIAALALGAFVAGILALLPRSIELRREDFRITWSFSAGRAFLVRPIDSRQVLAAVQKLFASSIAWRKLRGAVRTRFVLSVVGRVVSWLAVAAVVTVTWYMTIKPLYRDGAMPTEANSSYYRGLAGLALLYATLAVLYIMRARRQASPLDSVADRGRHALKANVKEHLTNKFTGVLEAASTKVAKDLDLRSGLPIETEVGNVLVQVRPKLPDISSAFRVKFKERIDTIQVREGESVGAGFLAYFRSVPMQVGFFVALLIVPALLLVLDGPDPTTKAVLERLGADTDWRACKDSAESFVSQLCSTLGIEGNSDSATNSSSGSDGEKLARNFLKGAFPIVILITVLGLVVARKVLYDRSVDQAEAEIERRVATAIAQAVAGAKAVGKGARKVFEDWWENVEKDLDRLVRVQRAALPLSADEARVASSRFRTELREVTRCLTGIESLLRDSSRLLTRMQDALDGTRPRSAPGIRAWWSRWRQ